MLGGQYRLERYVSIFNSCGIESIKCKQQRDPCVRACDRTVELSRWKMRGEKKRWRQLNCNSGVDGWWELMSVKSLSIFHLHPFATRTMSQARDYKRDSFILYSHLKQVLYRHPDRRKWQTHGNVCGPRNNTLWKERKNIKHWPWYRSQHIACPLKILCYSVI